MEVSLLVVFKSLFQFQVSFSGSLNPVENSSDTILSSLSCLENPHGNLHVTTFFNKRGQPQRAYNYASSSVVQDALGSVATLMVIACTVTPRTLTARVKLNSQQLALWANFNSLDFEEGRDNFNTTLLTVSSCQIQLNLISSCIAYPYFKY